MIGHGWSGTPRQGMGGGTVREEVQLCEAAVRAVESCSTREECMEVANRVAIFGEEN